MPQRTASNELAPGIAAERRIPYDLSGDLDMVFTIDLDDWAPRPAVYRAAVEFAETYGFRIPGNQEVFRALRARGFREAKRRGVWGFIGIGVPARLAEGPRIVPDGTAARYYRGDRTDAAKEAAFNARIVNNLKRAVLRDAHMDDAAEFRVPLSPWASTPRTPFERDIARIEAMGRRYRAKPSAEPWVD